MAAATVCAQKVTAGSDGVNEKCQVMRFGRKNEGGQCGLNGRIPMGIQGDRDPRSHVMDLWNCQQWLGAYLGRHTWGQRFL